MSPRTDSTDRTDSTAAVDSTTGHDRRPDHAVTAPTPLLDARGHLTEPGYATSMVFEYNPDRIAACPLRRKEWDFYQMMMGEDVLQMTIGHVGYMGSFDATLFSLDGEVRRHWGRLRPVPLVTGLRMPTSPEISQNLAVDGRGWKMAFGVRDNRRRLSLQVPAKNIDVAVDLSHDPAADAMVIATPFPDNPRQFYLNEKRHFAITAGRARFGDVTALAHPGDTGLLDWGRGVWPFHQEWWWGCGSRGRFGFNIGWGFGDTRHASENMIFWDGIAHKLGEVRAEYDPGDLLAPWHFRDDAGRLDLVMTPIYNNETATKVAFVDNHVDQVFGRFNGWTVLDSGERVEVRDLVAFCEHAANNW